MDVKAGDSQLSHDATIGLDGLGKTGVLENKASPLNVPEETVKQKKVDHRDMINLTKEFSFGNLHKNQFLTVHH
ncbi:MAG: hypothetical protein V1897_05570 [Pseudomonadota bacterium]